VRFFDVFTFCRHIKSHLLIIALSFTQNSYVGTRLLATNEASVEQRYKDMIVDSGSADVTYTKEISGVHANFLSKSIAAAGLDPTALKPNNSEINFGKELSVS
jgi:NAD(P)H-dependent flavin oxidoreductase YrpB (nitropropane dioxygenase family)